MFQTQTLEQEKPLTQTKPELLARYSKKARSRGRSRRKLGSSPICICEPGNVKYCVYVVGKKKKNLCETLFCSWSLSFRMNTECRTTVTTQHFDYICALLRGYPHCLALCLHCCFLHATCKHSFYSYINHIKKTTVDDLCIINSCLYLLSQRMAFDINKTFQVTLMDGYHF